MADILDVCCLDCGNRDEQLRGALMVGVIVRCLECGQSTVDSVGFSSRGPLSAADPDPIRCDFGGSFDPDAQLRCWTCRSTNLRSAPLGIAD